VLYSTFLGTALSLFGAAAWLTPRLDGEVGLGLLRFVVLCLAIGCSVGTWATAVTMASIHKQTWALYLTVAVVLAAFLTFLTLC
jgi:hypothetical protein